MPPNFPSFPPHERTRSMFDNTEMIYETKRNETRCTFAGAVPPKPITTMSARDRSGIAISLVLLCSVCQSPDARRFCSRRSG